MTNSTSRSRARRMGSAALYQLARRGVRVLGIEQFAPGHDRGSSHGVTRIIRLGYFEHPSYVPLVRAAYRSGARSSARPARRSSHVTGIIEIGAPDSALVAGTLRSARLHGLPHEVLGRAELMRRFPAFRLPPTMSAWCSRTADFWQPSPRSTPMVALARSRCRGRDRTSEPWAIEPTSRRRAHHHRSRRDRGRRTRSSRPDRGSSGCCRTFRCRSG